MSHSQRPSDAICRNALRVTPSTRRLCSRFNRDAQSVAERLDMHIKSVYRAREQVTQLLQEKVAAMTDED